MEEGGGREGGKVRKSKMMGHSCTNSVPICAYFFYVSTFAMCLLSLNCAYLCLLLLCAYNFKVCLLVPTFPMCLLF